MWRCSILSCKAIARLPWLSVTDGMSWYGYDPSTIPEMTCYQLCSPTAKCSALGTGRQYTISFGYFIPWWSETLKNATQLSGVDPILYYASPSYWKQGFSIGYIYIWGKTNFEKASPKQFFDVLTWCMKISFNSKFLTVYTLFAGSNVHNLQDEILLGNWRQETRLHWKPSIIHDINFGFTLEGCNIANGRQAWQKWQAEPYMVLS